MKAIEYCSKRERISRAVIKRVKSHSLYNKRHLCISVMMSDEEGDFCFFIDGGWHILEKIFGANSFIKERPTNGIETTELVKKLKDYRVYASPPGNYIYKHPKLGVCVVT